MYYLSEFDTATVISEVVIRLSLQF